MIVAAAICCVLPVLSLMHVKSTFASEGNWALSRISSVNSMPMASPNEAYLNRRSTTDGNTYAKPSRLFALPWQ
jgi:hypothetical protein